MAHDLDDISVQTDCPACAGPLSVAYKTLRLHRTVECPSCGETIRLIDETPIGKLQALIDAQDGASNDDADETGKP